MFWNRSYWENQNTHFVFKNISFENRAVYEITWENFGEPGRPQMAVQYGAEKMQFACR
jgi:hypothetical protein